MPARVALVAVGGLVAAGLAAGAVALTPSGSPASAPRAVAPPVAVAEDVPHVPVPPVVTAPSPAARRAVVVRKVRVAAPPPPSPTPRPVKAKVAVKPVAPVRVETAVQRGTRVLASLKYDWKRLGYRIEFKPGRKGYLGLTDEGTKTITIWVRGTDFVLAHTIAHELGHALDFSHSNEAKQRAYLVLRGMSPLADWYGCNGCTDYRTPAGDWAEVFAYWLAGPGDFRSQLGPPPSAAQMKAIAQLYTY